MALDLHKLRSICHEGRRQIRRADSSVKHVADKLRGMGWGFSADPMFAREYATYKARHRDAERALDRLDDALDALLRKAR
jgi:hypothetical protein